MSLDLDIKLSKKLKLNDLLAACREEIMKLTENARIPCLQADLFEGGSKLAIHDEYVLKPDAVAYIKCENLSDEIALIITEQPSQYVADEEAGIWAGVAIQGINNINFLLAAGVALAIAKACDTDIIDERTVWSSKRENTYNKFREEIKGRIRVNKQVNQFFEKMLTFFPSAEKLYWEHIDEYKERLDTCVIEDIFMPGVLELLREEKDTELLKSLFDYFEEVSKSEVDCLRNIFSVTVLEMFGSDSVLLEKAQKYMGPKTRMLQRKVDKGGCSHVD